MSESETPPYHQCKSETELRFQIADEIFDALSAKAKVEIDPASPSAILVYLKATTDAVHIARGGKI